MQTFCFYTETAEGAIAITVSFPAHYLLLNSHTHDSACAWGRKAYQFYANIILTLSLYLAGILTQKDTTIRTV